MTSSNSNGASLRNRVLLPITLDRWRSPIATLLRACAWYNPQHDFYSFSNPAYEEDRREGGEFWNASHIHSSQQIFAPLRRYDMSHIASLTGKNVFASRLAKVRSRGKCQFLVTINLELEKGHPAYWAEFLQTVKYADHFVAVSETVATMVKPYVGDRFRGVIPNGFDPLYFDPVLARTDSLPEAVARHAGRPYVLYVAALEPRKRPDVIIQLARENPDLWFVCAGYVIGEYGQNCIEEFDNVPNLIWLGHVDRAAIRELLRNASVMAFPSEREGLPLAVIEALGMGVPVVAQPKSSLPELIVDGGNGNLIEATDLNAWSKALRVYLSLAQGERSNLSSSIREETISKYAWSSIGQQYGELYSKILR